MKKVTRSDLQQPEITPEYIEYLFSGEKPKKAKWPVPKKLWFVLGGGILAVALVCLLLPILSAWLLPGCWQDRAATAYEALVTKTALHFTYQVAGSSEKTETWHYGNNSLSITYQGENHSAYSLLVGGRLYTREVTPEDPDATWSDIDVMIDRVSWADTLAETGYVFSKARGSITGVEVTYAREGADSYLVFRFNAFGKLTGLTRSVPYFEEQTDTFVCYTFLDTKPEEIQKVISDHHQEAIKGK